jgi:hypothetical protein
MTPLGGTSSSTACAAAIPEAKVSARPPSKAPIACSSACQVGLLWRPYPIVAALVSCAPTYVEAKTTGGFNGASTDRSGRPAVTATVSTCGRVERGVSGGWGWLITGPV